MPNIDVLHGNTGLRTLDSLRRERQVSSELGKNEFLNILMVQMANQNPLEPTSDTEFIAQMAQFSSLEQMQNLNEISSQNQTRELIGKFVLLGENENVLDGELIYRKVEGIVKRGGIEYLLVEDTLYNPSMVHSIIDPEDLGYETDNQNIAKYSNLIGKEVEGLFIDEEGEESKLSGRVEAISYEEGLIYAHLDQGKLAIRDINRISA